MEQGFPSAPEAESIKLELDTRSKTSSYVTGSVHLFHVVNFKCMQLNVFLKKKEKGKNKQDTTLEMTRNT